MKLNILQAIAETYKKEIQEAWYTGGGGLKGPFLIWNSSWDHDDLAYYTTGGKWTVNKSDPKIMKFNTKDAAEDYVIAAIKAKKAGFNVSHRIDVGVDTLKGMQYRTYKSYAKAKKPWNDKLNAAGIKTG